jgi:serine/threonine protein kinase
MKKLNKTHGGANQDVKYFIDCSSIDPQKTFMVEKHIPSGDAKVMLIALKQYSMLGMKNKKIVAKISSHEQSTTEYKISKYFHDCGVQGFMKYLCLFQCDDDVNDKTSMCDGKTISDKKSVILMPYFSKSLVDHKFSSVQKAEIFLKKAVEILGETFIHHGYLHNDIHEGNFMVSNKGDPIITDFVRSRFVDTSQKDTHRFLWMDLLGLMRFSLRSTSKKTSYRVKNPTKHFDMDQMVSHRNLRYFMDELSMEEYMNPQYVDIDTLVKMRRMNVHIIS